MLIKVNNLVLTKEKSEEVVNRISSFVGESEECVKEVFNYLYFNESMHVEFPSDLEFGFMMKKEINGKVLVFQGNHLNEMPQVYLYSDLKGNQKKIYESIEDKDLEVVFKETIKVQTIARALSLLTNLDIELIKAEQEMIKNMRQLGVA